MQVRIEDIPEAGLEVTDPVPADFLNEVLPHRPDFVLAGDAKTSLRLQKEGERVHIKGEAVAPVAAACGRCLKEFTTQLKADFDLRLFKAEPETPKEEESVEAEAGDEEFSADAADVGVGEYDGKVVEWGDMVREQMLLNVPMQLHCQADCKGLCPSCGVNRNEKSCSCEEARWDPRWDKLREMKLE